jgi:long-chain acyl-CoA synthetase
MTTYSELAVLAHRFADELARRGITPGERVVLWGRNSAEWIAAFFGCVEAGVLVVPLDASGSREFAQHVMQEVSPRLIVAETALLRSVHFETAHLELEHLKSILPETRDRAARPVLSLDSPLQILFTSGTTGAPKGIVHTHRNLLASLLPIEREIRKYRHYARLVHPLRFLHTLPLSHVFGQFMGLWVPPLLGATVHYESRSTGSRVAALIPEEHIHVLAAVPRTLELLRAHLLAGDPALAEQITQAQGLPILKRWWRFRRVHRHLGLRFWAAVCGGATLPSSVEQFWTTLGFALIQGYGLTETAALVTLNHPFKIAHGSLGAPLPGRSLRVSESGELEVKGDMVSTATWQHGGLIVRNNPWLATGDLASLSEDGRVRFLGRLGQRLVTAAGLNVYLQDVEATLEAQQGVDEAVALPIRSAGVSDEGDEVPGAVVVARGGFTEAEQAVFRANQILAAHQQVRRWWLWPELALPRTGSGKVARKAVEIWVQSQLESGISDAGTSDESSADPLEALLLSVGARRGPLDDTARLEEDWSLDSMGRVALTAALEQQTGIAFPEGGQAPLRTLGDLRTLLRQPASMEASTSADGSANRATFSAPGQSGARENLSASMLPREPPVNLKKKAETTSAAHNPTWRYPTWPWTWPIPWIRAVFIEGILRPLVWLVAAPRVCRAARDAALPHSMLLISNHRTSMDVPLLLYALPRATRRRVAVAMSGEMLAGWQQSCSLRALPPALSEHRRWWGPIAAVLLQALLNVFPLPRTVGFRAGFEHAGKALDRGYSVLIFPEGRRGPGAELLAFKGGVGILAEESFVAILPMALVIDDAKEQLWKRGGAAIAIGSAAHISSGATKAEITETVRSQVQILLRRDAAQR